MQVYVPSMPKRKIVLLIALCLLHTLHAQTSLKIIQQCALFDSSAPFTSCHASTIVSLGGDQLMTAWFGGSAEGRPDVKIWGMQINKNIKGTIIELAEGRDAAGKPVPCWNPVLFYSNHVLYLFYKAGPNPREWWGEYKTSLDKGQHWSEAKRLPYGFLGPVRNQPIRLQNGNWLFPSSTEAENGEWKVQMEITDADLQHWNKITVPPGNFSVIQPAILQHGKRLQILCRSKQNIVTESWSEDGGLHWSEMKATDMPNPNSGIDAITLRNGKHLLVYNPLTAGKDWWEGRSVLRMAVSQDGKKWKDLVTLEEHTSGEYSYPYLIEDEKGYIHITYTDQRKTIQYVKLSY
jgi:alpha-L-fucosidase